MHDLDVTPTPDRGPGWIQTYTGRPYWPLDPRAEDVCVEDIAHMLSMKCRFSGATVAFYSVAQHSTILSRAVPGHLAWAALHHDDPEAYLVDLVTPVKLLLPGWEDIEAANMRVTAIETFGVHPDELLAVKPYDKRLATDERICLMGPSLRPWDTRYPRLGVDIVPLPPEAAEQEYLARHHELLALHSRPEGPAFGR